eukprot:CAMPEP_0172596872 /NCGR_PEP_ID=MMETSP1068-20121228/16741_1 /TAXON_ID=35684 /ORGANISM="Pseudopedinella elastica, Strain CCMP716" /LENGTH=147 /DNA_ID=CAMNT_0013396111 /DNA_START=496 /DNA_END=939 /DNA_ORIENTATION=-
MGERVSIHARRGDKINLHHISEDELKRIYLKVEHFLLTGRYTKVYLASDDKTWATRYANHLRNLGVDTIYRVNSKTVDDAAAMMASKFILSTTTSMFSTVLAVMSGLPLITFIRSIEIQNEMTFKERRSSELHIPWETEGILNVTSF